MVVTICHGGMYFRPRPALSVLIVPQERRDILLRLAACNAFCEAATALMVPPARHYSHPRLHPLRVLLRRDEAVCSSHAARGMSRSSMLQAQAINTVT